MTWTEDVKLVKEALEAWDMGDIKVAFIASELGVDVATVELDSFGKERVFREMGSAVESKFEHVGMARWFGHPESIDGLLNLWSGRLCILFHYLIMTGMPLEEYACQTRPKAPQIRLPRDIHTLTTFWCYRLSFVAEGDRRESKNRSSDLSTQPDLPQWKSCSRMKPRNFSHPHCQSPRPHDTTWQGLADRPVFLTQHHLAGKKKFARSL